MIWRPLFLLILAFGSTLRAESFVEGLKLHPIETAHCRVFVSAGYLDQKDAIVTAVGELIAEQKRLTSMVDTLSAQAGVIQNRLNEHYAIVPKADAAVHQRRLIGVLEGGGVMSIAAGEKLSVYLIQKSDALAYVKEGGVLPHVVHEAETDSISLTAPDTKALVFQDLPLIVGEGVAPDALIRRFTQAYLVGITETAVFTSLLGASRFTLVEEILPPTEIFTRWFVSGMSRHVARDLAREFFPEARFEAVLGNKATHHGYKDIRNEVNLLSWLESNRIVQPRIAVETRLAAAREHFAMWEIDRLVKVKGKGTIGRLAKAAGDQRRLEAVELPAIIKSVTGFEIQERLEGYQSYGSTESGVALYRARTQKANAEKDYEGVVHAKLRLIEIVRAGNLDPNMEYRNLATIMGRIGLVDDGMELMSLRLLVSDLDGDTFWFSKWQREFLIYGLRFGVHDRMYAAAEEVLLYDPENAWALTVQAHRLHAQGYTNSAVYLAKSYHRQLSRLSHVNIEVVFPVLEEIAGGKVEPATKSELEALQDSAHAGAVHCQFLLANRYLTGVTVEKDPVKAVDWLKKAADKGYGPAQSNLAMCYGRGVGVKKDVSQEMAWLIAAANKGHPMGTYTLAGKYLRGEGIAQDYALAAEYMRAATRLGVGAAYLDLGLMHNEGKGVPLSPETTVRLLKRAAARGSVSSKVALWEISEQSRGSRMGVPTYVVRRWLREAAEAGHPKAKAELKRLQAMAKEQQKKKSQSK